MLHSLQLISLIQHSIRQHPFSPLKMCSMNNNSVVILEDIALDLTDDVIAEITTGMEQVDGLVLEAHPETFVTAVTPAQSPGAKAGPSKTPGAASHLSSGRKNMKTLLKSLRSPSPTPSTISTQSSAADEDSDEFTKFLEDEQRRRADEEARRAEWSRRAVGRRVESENSLRKARDLVSSLTGEGKHLKSQREALRAQLRALDDQEVALEKRKRSAVKSVRKYETIVAKYKEMNI